LRASAVQLLHRPVAGVVAELVPAVNVHVARHPVRGGQFGQGIGDLLGCLRPSERARVFVPVLDPVADVGFQGLDGLVDAAADLLVGEAAEPALD
jgi:hypothetical protein